MRRGDKIGGMTDETTLAPTARTRIFQFDNSFARDLPGFYVARRPNAVRAPRLLFLNAPLADELRLDLASLDDAAKAAIFAGNAVPAGAEPLAQAYAGHQFGGFVAAARRRTRAAARRGDRPARTRRDIAFKGSGRTVFARNGDGKAAIGPMLREVLVSESMHALGIPTTRALAVAATGEEVYRERVLPGAVLTRVAASHIRVGTFQFYAARGDIESLRKLARLHDRAPRSRTAHGPAAVSRPAAPRRRATGVAHRAMDERRLHPRRDEHRQHDDLGRDDRLRAVRVHGGVRSGRGIQLHRRARPLRVRQPARDRGVEPRAIRRNAVAADRRRRGRRGRQGHRGARRVRARYSKRTCAAGSAPKLGLRDETPDDDAALVDDWLALLHAQRVDFTLAWRALADAADGNEAPLRALFADCTSARRLARALARACTGDRRDGDARRQSVRHRPQSSRRGSARGRVGRRTTSRRSSDCLRRCGSPTSRTTRRRPSRSPPRPKSRRATRRSAAPDISARAMRSTLPRGTVTFLFTDIDGSTRLWDRHPDEMRVALARHDALVRDAIEERDGHIFKTVGDAFCAAFVRPSDALAAARAAQRALLAEPWPAPIAIKVRMALHAGNADVRDGDYFGQPLNRVARLLAAGHGGQVLVSRAAAELLGDALAARISHARHGRAAPQGSCAARAVLSARRPAHCPDDSRRCACSMWPGRTCRRRPAAVALAARTMVEFDQFEVRPRERRLLVDGKEAILKSRAFDVLLALIERRDRLVPKSELLDVVWPDTVVEENNLQVHISALRKVLGPKAIATIPGRGYRFTAAPRDDAPIAPSSVADAAPAAEPLRPHQHRCRGRGADRAGRGHRGRRELARIASSGHDPRAWRHRQDTRGARGRARASRRASERHVVGRPRRGDRARPRRRGHRRCRRPAARRRRSRDQARDCAAPPRSPGRARQLRACGWRSRAHVAGGARASAKRDGACDVAGRAQGSVGARCTASARLETSTRRRTARAARAGRGPALRARRVEHGRARSDLPALEGVALAIEMAAARVPLDGPRRSARPARRSLSHARGVEPRCRTAGIRRFLRRSTGATRCCRTTKRSCCGASARSPAASDMDAAKALASDATLDEWAVLDAWRTRGQVAAAGRRARSAALSVAGDDAHVCARPAGRSGRDRPDCARGTRR